MGSFYISMFYLLLTRICHSSTMFNWSESPLVWRPLLLESESWLLLVVLLLLGKPFYRPTIPSLVPVKAFQAVATMAAVGLLSHVRTKDSPRAAAEPRTQPAGPWRHCHLRH